MTSTKGYANFHSFRDAALVLPAGGKQAVADLALFLNELGASWYAFFDNDALDNTSAAIFIDGILPAELATLGTAATALKARVQNLPTRDSKATKLLDAMILELATPPPRGLRFTGSVLDRFVRKIGAFATAELTALDSAVRSKKPKAIRRVLSPKRIWVWSSSLEEVILHNAAAENNADTVLRRRGLLNQVFADPVAKRKALIRLLHDCAHEPDAVREVTETIWTARAFDRAEVKSALAFLSI